jgi:hypothetical protein
MTCAVGCSTGSCNSPGPAEIKYNKYSKSFELFGREDRYNSVPRKRRNEMDRLVSVGLSFMTLCTVLATSAPDATAQVFKPYNVNARQNRQHKRISRGVNNGSLTGRETARLAHQQATLRAREARMRATGCGLTANERARLNHQQNQLSQNVYQQKHDAQSR